MITTQVADPVEPAPAVPQSIFDEDKLLVYRELYYDGFCSIIAARDLTSGTAVAVKKIDFHFLKPSPFSLHKLRENYVQKVKDQVEKMRALTHTSVVKMVEFVIEQNRVTIMTEMCMFGDLFNWMLQQPQLRVRDVCLIVQNIFQALSFLHSQDYVHGELSPTAILFQSMSPQSVTILPDLSVRSELLKVINVEPPTVDCYSPERLKVLVQTLNKRELQLSDDGLKSSQFVPTKASDVWSIGIIAHIALTGKAPFEGDSAAEMLESIEKANGRSENKMLSTLSSMIREQMIRILSVDPERRGTADEGAELYWFDDEKTKNDNRNILMITEYDLLNTCRRYRNQGRQVFETVFRKNLVRNKPACMKTVPGS